MLPALIGGALELIQNYCTTYRSGEWLDFVADSIGAAIVGAIVVIYVVCKRK
jgi:VanZ family protein